MNKRLTRHDMTQKDQFVTAVEHGAGWLEHNWRKVAITAGVVLGAVILASLVVSYQLSRAREADAALGDAMTLMTAQVLTPGELPPLSGAVTFDSPTQRDTAVLEKLDVVLAGHASSRAAVTAAYLRGAVLLRLGRHDDAAAALESFIADHGDTDMGPAARRALATAHLQAGRTDEGLNALQAMADAPSLLFPADAATMELARAQEAAGRKDDALASYRRLVNEYPQSFYSGDARQAVIRLSDPAGGNS